MSAPRGPNTLDDKATEHMLNRNQSYVMYDPRYHAPASLVMISKYDYPIWGQSVEPSRYISAIARSRPAEMQRCGAKRLSFQE